MRKPPFTIYVIAVLLAVVGCATIPAAQSYKTLTDGVSAAKAEINSALGILAQLDSHLDATGREIADACKTQLASAITDLGHVDTGGSKLKADDDKTHADLKEIQGDFFYRAGLWIRGAFWTCIGIGIFVVIVLPILYSCFGGELTAFGAILRQIHAALPAQNLGNWINTLLLKKTVVALPTSTTNPSNVAIVNTAADGTKTASALPANKLFLDTADSAKTIAGG